MFIAGKNLGIVYFRVEWLFKGRLISILSLFSSCEKNESTKDFDLFRLTAVLTDKGDLSAAVQAALETELSKFAAETLECSEADAIKAMNTALGKFPATMEGITKNVVITFTLTNLSTTKVVKTTIVTLKPAQ
ncbi:MAG: hypothetical protein PHV49_01205 [Alistipes sp.]|nr:hypothetical protein [Alistipes sp.]